MRGVSDGRSPAAVEWDISDTPVVANDVMYVKSDEKEIIVVGV